MIVNKCLDWLNFLIHCRKCIRWRLEASLFANLIQQTNKNLIEKKKKKKKIFKADEEVEVLEKV